MTEPPQYPAQPDPSGTPAGAVPPPPVGGYGTPPPAGGGYGTPPPTGPWVPGPPPLGPAPRDAGSAIGYGWRKTWQYPGVFIVLGLLAFVVPGLVNGFGSGLSVAGEILAAEVDGARGASIMIASAGLDGVLAIAAQLVTALMMAALLRAALDAAEGQAPSIGGAFTRWVWWKVVLNSLLTCLLMIPVIALTVAVFAAGGALQSVALVIVGGVLGVAACFAVVFLTYLGPAFVVARGLGPVAALRASVRFTSRHVGALLALAILSTCVMLLGFLACCIGMIVALPVTQVALIHLFKALHDEQVAL